MLRTAVLAEPQAEEYACPTHTQSRQLPLCCLLLTTLDQGSASHRRV